MSTEQPYASQLTLNRFLLVMAAVAISISAVLIVLLRPTPVSANDLPFAIIGSVILSLFGGFTVAGMVYLFCLMKNMKHLHMTENDLLLGEMVVRETAGSMVHYRTGRTWCFWEADGGRLFLTNGYLIFKTHGGQPTQYTLAIPLAEVADVRSCTILGIFSGGLRVDTTDGYSELFTFGAVGVNSPSSWAADILSRRDCEAGWRQLGEGIATDD